MGKFEKYCLLFAGCWILIGTSGAHAQSDWGRLLRSPQANVNAMEAKVAGGTYNPLRCTGFRWNEGQVQWDTVSQSIFNYNNTGGVLVKTGSTWTPTGFEPDFRESHAYNTMGYDSMTVTEDWNGTAWEPSYRFVRAFDPFGNVTQSIGQVWNGTDWDTSSGYRAIFTYRNTDQIASVEQESYVVGAGWDPDYRMEYSFDQFDQWDTVVGYDRDQGLWVPDLRLVGLGWYDFEKSLPDSGRYEEFGTTWENFQRFHVTYGQYDSQVWIYQKFATTWDDSDKLVINYDAKGNETLNETSRWIGAWLQTDGILTHYVYGPQDEKLEVWQEVFDGYIYRYDNRQVYLEFLVGQTAPIAATVEVTVFPNPVLQASDFQFRIVMEKPSQVTFSLYDLQGRRLLQQISSSAAVSEINVPISGTIGNGTYLYRVEAGDGQALGTIVVQR